ncbi:MAG: DUF4091 domain-containing protein [Pirellulaceae bacterium]|nr:DUF4091 domain-containing protein [Pirellulaceae bacterium]
MLRVLPLAAMCFSLPCLADEPGANLLENPGFEFDWDEDGLPDDWQMLTQKGKPIGRNSTDRPQSGRVCVFAETPSTDDVGYWSQIVTLKPGMKRFRLTASARAQDDAQANVSFSAYAHGTSKWLAADYSLNVAKASPEWQTRTVEFEVPEGTGSVRIALWCNYAAKGHGRVWFDELRLQPLDWKRAAAPANLATNSGFEEVVPTGGRPRDWLFSKSGGDAKPLPHCDQPHAGSVSAGIEVEPGGSGLLWQWAPMSKGWPVYRLTAWVRTEGEARALGSLSVYTADKEKWVSAGYELFDVEARGKWHRVMGFYEPPPVDGIFKIALWAKANEQGGGKVWFDDVELRPVDSVPPTPYVPSTEPLAATADERACGFVVFNRNYLNLMPPTYRPSPAEIQQPIAVAAALGEYEPISVGVYALEDIEGLRVSPSEFHSVAGASIPTDCIDVRVVRYLVKRSHYGLQDRVLVPTYLEQDDTLRVAKDQVGQFWLTVHVPDDATPGEYRGELQLTRADGRAKTRVPVTFRVYPFALDKPEGMAFGMYDAHQRTVPGPDFLEAKYRDMRAHGMTTVGFCGNLGAVLRVVDGQVEVRFEGKTGLETAMDAYLRAGFPEPAVWLMGSDVRQFCTQLGPIESEEFGRTYKTIVQAVLAEGKRRSWPEIIIQPEDEVYAHTKRFEVAFRELELLKEIPGVRTEMDGTNVRPQLSDKTYPLTDVLVHCYGPMRYGRRVYPRDEWLDIAKKYHADGKRIWFYNVDTTGYHVETMRFAAGLYLIWSNADGLLSWAYSWGDSKPFDDYSGPRGDTIFFYPPRGKRRGGPALGLEGLREGIDDFRYVRTLTNRIEESQRSQNVDRRALARKAREMLDGWIARLDLSRLRTNRSMQGDWTVQTVSTEGQTAVGGSFKLDVGLSLDDYNRFRQSCARYIETLAE